MTEKTLRRKRYLGKKWKHKYANVSPQSDSADNTSRVKQIKGLRLFETKILIIPKNERLKLIMKGNLYWFFVQIIEKEMLMFQTNFLVTAFIGEASEMNDVLESTFTLNYRTLFYNYRFYNKKT